MHGHARTLRCAALRGVGTCFGGRISTAVTPADHADGRLRAANGKGIAGLYLGTQEAADAGPSHADYASDITVQGCLLYGASLDPAAYVRSARAARRGRRSVRACACVRAWV